MSSESEQTNQSSSNAADNVVSSSTEKNLSSSEYQDNYKKYSKNYFAANYRLHAQVHMKKQRIFEQYLTWSKLETERYLTRFMEQPFYKIIASQLLAYDYNLKKNTIQLAVCDQFKEGVFIPKEDKILLCSNILTEQSEFDNALRRQLIRLYDYHRSSNYSYDNCKHLACTEVRAALFSTRCETFKNLGIGSKFEGNQKKLEKQEANEFCLKELAQEKLKERNKCAEKAARYIEYVFDTCKNDTAPFNSSGRKSNRVKSLTDVL